MSEFWWASFADEDGPRGVVITSRENAEDIVALARRLWMLGLNPGGELMADYTTAENWRDSGEAWVLEPDNQDRIIEKAELQRRGYVSRGELNPQGFDREAFEADADSKTLPNEPA